MADEEEDPTVSDHHCSTPLFSSLPGVQKRILSSESLEIFLSEFPRESSGTSRRASLSLRIHLLVRGAGRDGRVGRWLLVLCFWFVFARHSLNRLDGHQRTKLIFVSSHERTLQLFEEENEEIGGGAEGGQGKRKRLFSKELRCMMYGFGDDQNPYTESVDILEDLVIEFITEMTHKAMSIGRQGRVQVEDIVFLIRKDPRKFARVKDLLTMNEELKRARKAFDEANYGS
ncbi:transcription initiation factor TFIID subunit 13 isoform X1 [Mirounga angustirostris]|uniref:transcription initiation factor TFIID subunit 13 isoform X1 n=1 Tax=Mirounga angustirostris TaxID=9716 RepID=UPI001E68A74A